MLVCVLMFEICDNKLFKDLLLHFESQLFCVCINSKPVTEFKDLDTNVRLCIQVLLSFVY